MWIRVTICSAGDVPGELKHTHGRKTQKDSELHGARLNEKRRVREQLWRRKESIRESQSGEASIVRRDTMTGVGSQRRGRRSTAGELTGS